MYNELKSISLSKKGPITSSALVCASSKQKRSND